MAGESHFEVYPIKTSITRIPTGEYGWRFQNANGKFQAVGGEGFEDKDGAIRAIEDFVDELGIDLQDCPPVWEVDTQGRRVIDAA